MLALPQLDQDLFSHVDLTGSDLYSECSCCSSTVFIDDTVCFVSQTKLKVFAAAASGSNIDLTCRSELKLLVCPPSADESTQYVWFLYPQAAALNSSLQNRAGCKAWSYMSLASLASHILSLSSAEMCWTDSRRVLLWDQNRLKIETQESLTLYVIRKHSVVSCYPALSRSEPWLSLFEEEESGQKNWSDWDKDRDRIY